MENKLSDSIINFAEIKTANDFEMFTCDLLECMGFEIIIRPGEGSDGGRDMLVQETRRGTLADTKVRYLVSCKHLGRAVGTADEKDVPGRVHKHHCDAFLGVYSTHPSNTLVDDFNGWKSNPDQSRAFGAVILDGSGIRKQLLELSSGRRLVQQYFPRAHLAHRRLQTESNIYRKRPVFYCAECGINILDHLQGSIIVEAARAPAAHASGDPERDECHRTHVLGIHVFCPEHAPNSTRGMPNGSVIYRLENLIEPKAFMSLVNDGLKGMYFWSPHFSNEAAFIRWLRLVNGLFYFVARGHDPLLPRDGLIGLRDRYLDVSWEL